MTTLSDLAGQAFCDVPDAASVLGRDERTVRRGIEAGKISATKIGSKWAIPTAWIREQAGLAEPPSAAAVPDLDALADRVADRVVTRLAGLFTRGQDAEADGEPEAMS